jgi:DNA-binding MarR family transcriptional regulator
MSTDLGAVAKRTAVTNADPDDNASPTLLYLMGRMDWVVHRAIRDAIRDHGLSVGQYTALSVLGHRSGLSNAQLARRSLVSPQSAHEVLLALEQRGLVRRRAHADHGRILQTRPTAKGRRVLEACNKQVHDVELGMVKGLTRQQQAALRHALLSCVRAMHGGLDEEE